MYVVVVTGETVMVPESAFRPLQPPLAVQLVKPVTSQVRVAVVTPLMEETELVKEMLIGTVFVKTVRAREAAEVLPARSVAVSLYVYEVPGVRPVSV